MSEYLRLFRAARAGEHACANSVNSAKTPQNGPIGTRVKTQLTY
jgi:hypothetical protein